MKIVLEHGATKRIIEGPFNICGSREDLQSLVDQLTLRITHTNFCYGWVPITLMQSNPTNANTPPKRWDE